MGYADGGHQALCHCVDCRKIGGANYSNNFVIPASQFNVTAGTPKEFSKTADSGKEITSCFCGDCGMEQPPSIRAGISCQRPCFLKTDSGVGTTLFRYGETFGGRDGMMVVKAGILDDVDVINSHKPGAELYAPERVKWVAQVEGTDDLEGMPQA